SKVFVGEIQGGTEGVRWKRRCQIPHIVTVDYLVAIQVEVLNVAGRDSIRNGRIIRHLFGALKEAIGFVAPEGIDRISLAREHHRIDVGSGNIRTGTRQANHLVVVDVEIGTSGKAKLPECIAIGACKLPTFIVYPSGVLRS